MKKHDENTQEMIERVIENMYSNDMETAKFLSETAQEIINKKYNVSDWLWRYVEMLTVVYLVGKEEGVKKEREKKRHNKKWLY